MPSMGFEPQLSANKGPHTHALGTLDAGSGFSGMSASNMTYTGN
jgi:hypothetical protein